MKFQYSRISGWGMMLLAAALMVTVSSCKPKEGCTDPNALNYDVEAEEDNGTCDYATPNLKLHVHSMVGMQDFSYNTTYTAPDGRQFKFTTARCYVSGIQAGNATGGHAINKYLQFDAGTMMYEVGEIPAGSYNGISFNIGVDSASNHADPTAWPDGHALSASSPTHDFWNWNSGYIFLRIEGLVDTSAAMTGTVDGPFEMHIGGDNFLRNVDLAKNFDVQEGVDVEVMVMIDWLKALENVDMRGDNTTHTMDNMPLAMLVMNNFITGFSI